MRNQSTKGRREDEDQEKRKGGFASAQLQEWQSEAKNVGQLTSGKRVDPPVPSDMGGSRSRRGGKTRVNSGGEDEIGGGYKFELSGWGENSLRAVCSIPKLQKRGCKSKSDVILHSKNANNENIRVKKENNCYWLKWFGVGGTQRSEDKCELRSPLP